MRRARIDLPLGRLTFDGVAEGVYAERDRDEKGEDLLGGPGRPAHEPRHVEQRIEHEEEGRPQADAAVHCEEIQLEILADAVYHCQIRKQQDAATGQCINVDWRRIRERRRDIISSA